MVMNSKYFTTMCNTKRQQDKRTKLPTIQKVNLHYGAIGKIFLTYEFQMIQASTALK